MSTDSKRVVRRSADQNSASPSERIANGTTPAARRTTPKSSPIHHGVASRGRKVAPAGQSISEPQTATPTPVHIQYNTFRNPFFSSIRSTRREYFTIHPEWASERVSAPLVTAGPQHQPPSTWTNTYPPPHTGRRCRSAPPGMRSRNPITWENW